MTENIPEGHAGIEHATTGEALPQPQLPEPKWKVRYPGLKPFKKGDARINRKGRPKSFDALRNLAQAIAHEVAVDKKGRPVVIDGHTMTIAEMIMRDWAQSRNPLLQRSFVEVAFGKVPDNVNVKVTRPVEFKVVYEDAPQLEDGRPKPEIIDADFSEDIDEFNPEEDEI